MSAAFLGVQIDAVYHTSLVFGGVEYFFGAGIQTSRPGQTHHGRPMEMLPLGRTELDLEIIREYLESLQVVYTPEVGRPLRKLPRFPSVFPSEPCLPARSAATLLLRSFRLG